jgi:hypothetical protein
MKTYRGWSSVLPKQIYSQRKLARNPYFLVRGYGVVHIFLGALQNIEFHLKTQRG